MNAPLPLTPLGSTGFQVSALALGTVKFGRTAGLKYPQNFALPSDAELQELLHAARSLGINLLDTAPAYGSSEARLGQLLGQQRKDWLLCSKVGEQFSEQGSSHDFRAAAVAPSIEASLRRLNTDYLDIALIHSDGNDLRILNQARTLDALQDLKRAGLIRAVGMSHKTLAGGRRALELGADVLMTELSSAHRDMAPLIAECAAQNVGVLIKKALGSGHAGAESLAYVAGCEGVSSIVVGTINKAHLQENARIVGAALRAPGR
ncbi:MAG: aldo/keto reductase [Pseudomonadales bacterium]